MLKSCRMRNELGSRGRARLEMPKWGFDTSIFSCSALCSEWDGCLPLLHAWNTLLHLQKHSNCEELHSHCIGKPPQELFPRSSSFPSGEEPCTPLTWLPMNLLFYPYTAVFCSLMLECIYLAQSCKILAHAWFQTNHCHGGCTFL